MDLYEGIILSISTGLLLASQVVYITNTAKKKIEPNVLSWVGWSMLMAASMLSQIVEEGWDVRHLGVCLSSLGCFLVVVTALLKRNFVLERNDWWFLALGMACFVVYLSTKDPILTTTFAILADFVLGVPTIKKAIYFPAKERSWAWRIGTISWGVHLLLGWQTGWLPMIFPVYLFVWSVMMVLLTRKSRVLALEKN